MKFYITTAIDYPNGMPHMGHAYEKIVTDFYARYYALRGRDVRFLTGTDENGQKLKSAANAAGMKTKEYVDYYANIFRGLCKNLGISHNDFIRTTEERHYIVVQEIWKQLLAKGLIYLGEYTNYYCDACENFYPETDLEEGLRCPHHHKELPLKTEKGYFLKLGQHQDWLISFIEDNPEFIVPKGPCSEILSRLKKEPVRDISVSRINEGWGIEVPGDEKYVIYTWFDALINYYSALGESDRKYWPASCHVIGRDIIWFHCVVWPIILHSVDMDLPSQVYVHGMVLGEDGRKMSKSLGNGVEPATLLSKYDLDTFRFYVLKYLPSHSDGRFSESELVGCHNGTLANDYGNLVMRVVKMSLKKIGASLAYEDGFTEDFNFCRLEEEFHKSVLMFRHDKALGDLWSEVQKVNGYINARQPWKVQGSDELRSILFNCIYAIHTLTHFLRPAMPTVAQKVLDIIGAEVETDPLKAFCNMSYTLQEPSILFQKIEHG